MVHPSILRTSLSIPDQISVQYKFTALVGNVCLDAKREVVHPSILRTSLSIPDQISVQYKFTPKSPDSTLSNPFETFADDDEPGLSLQDKKFLSILSDGITTTPSGNLQLPIPLKDVSLPTNKSAVFTRTKKTLSNLKNQPSKLESCVTSIQKSLDANFIEEVPPNAPEPSRAWYLPVFCVQHPKKPKARMVYDASARYQGVSLNDCLYSGPDLNNQLRGVLLRFREQPIAFAADIENMFSNFKVPEEQRDFLRFFWFQGNNPSNPIVPFRCSSHIFGACSSPAVATFAMKFCAANLPTTMKSVKYYIDSSFYVDDGIFSCSTPGEAIEILTGAISCLRQYNVRLHVIVSNCNDVTNAFPSSELASMPSALPNTQLCLHNALGITWDTYSDSFVIQVSLPCKAFTKRGVLSTINSLYDPIGFISPAILEGRVIQRKVLPPNGSSSELQSLDWDDPLPVSLKDRWDRWLTSVSLLNDLRIPRSFFPVGFEVTRQEIHIFADASENAIGFVAYMRSLNNHGMVHVAFITASSRVTPRSATSMPRLELCAALEASRCASTLLKELHSKPSVIFMHSDSQIVLGYIANHHRRFSKYIERRVSLILKRTLQENWLYVPTKLNPADLASRPQTPVDLMTSCWFPGPPWLQDPEYIPSPSLSVALSTLPEEKLNPSVLQTKGLKNHVSSPFLHLFDRMSSLNKLVRVATNVMKFIRKIDLVRQKMGYSLAPRQTEISRQQAINLLAKQAQKDKFQDVIGCLSKGKCLPESHGLSQLSPSLDSEELVRVGGRLGKANIEFSIKHPIILPKDHNFSKIIIEFFHSQVKHQGSCISHSAIISAGFYIHHGRQLLRKFLQDCVICRKLRAQTCNQIMADLPLERLEDTPPFSVVGTDVFGPFHISNGQATRKTSSSKKIWVAIFVCLPSRAVHLEPLHGMDVSSFRNALARFTSIRGPCQTILSDQGTNFVCAKKQLDSIDIAGLSDDLKNKGIHWKLNPPHASHFGGSWERKIGSIRRVMEASYALTGNRLLSLDEFTTVLAEASYIVNNTPLWPISQHPDEPLPLTPMMLLTLRNDNQQCPTLLDSYSEKDILAYGQRRYRRVQYLASQFWLRWKSEYLHTLSLRHKWKTQKTCISVGDIVLLRDKSTSRNFWTMGRIGEVKTSSDGLVRSASVVLPPLPGRTQPRQMLRPISDLVLLIPSNSTNHATSQK